MTKSEANTKPKDSIFKRIKKEISKDLLLFSAGAISASFYMISRRRQQKLKARYKEEIKGMRQKKR